MESLHSSKFIALILYSLLAFNTSCQSQKSCLSQCSQLKFYDCRICNKICQQPITNPSESNPTINFTLQFQSCQEEYCAEWQTTTYLDSNNITQTDTHCVDYEWRDLTENQCTQSCCDHPGYYTFTAETFAQCVTANEEKHAFSIKLSMILGIVFGGICALVIFLCLCRCFFDRIRECLSKTFNFSDPIVSSNPQGQLPVIQNNQIRISFPSSKRIELAPIITLEWTEISSNIKQSVSEYCSICLDGNMNCETSCGHMFHLLCFHDWIRKSPDCPLCKSKTFNDVKVFCEKCKGKEAKLTLHPSSIISFMNGNQVNCDQCKHKPSIESSEYNLKMTES